MEETKDETKAEPAQKTTTPKVAAQPDHHHKWNPFVAKRVAMKLASPAHAAPAPAAAPVAAPVLFLSSQLRKFCHTSANLATVGPFSAVSVPTFANKNLYT